MFCFVYKWMISGALDTGKGFSPVVSGHIRRCAGCREFARAAASLNAGLSRDAGFFQDKTDALQEKIISALETTPVIELLPPKRRYIFMPVPALAAALVVVAAIGILLYILPVSSPETPGTPVSPLISIDKLPDAAVVKNPLKIVKEVESPIETEMNRLGQSIDSAARFLVSCLDIKSGALRAVKSKN